jgi:hypothetical protein
MSVEFYNKLLPNEGTYCVAVLPTGEGQHMRHIFVDSIEELSETIESKKQDSHVFIGIANFDGHSRKKAKTLKSFFVDLDVGDTKDYSSQEEAVNALGKFIQSQELPPPVVVDSGNGVHAYWMLDTEVSAEEWKIYADKFKQLCLNNGLRIDPAVTADKARILRCPDTFNFKSNPPTPTKIISGSINVYQFEMFKEFLGEEEHTPFEEIVKTKLTEVSRQMNGLGNFSSKFDIISRKSLDEESNEGCAQIRHIIRNRESLSEPLWYAGLSIAQHCVDRDVYIHMLSKDHPGYDPDKTEKKATQTQDKPQSCAVFNDLNPDICPECPHFGKITNPLILGKTFVSSPTAVEPIKTEVVTLPNGKPLVKTSLQGLPPEIEREGFYRGQSGGIYFKPAPVFDESGEAVEQKTQVVSIYDLYSLKRVISTHEGNCLLMKVDPPHDEPAEFYVPFSVIYDSHELRKTISKHGVLFNPHSNQWKLIMNYLLSWGSYLQADKAAAKMRTQMGWTPDHDAFVVGDVEIKRDGSEVNSPTSPLCRNIARHIVRTGSYDKWKEVANKLNREGLEIHAFVMLTGFGSTLLNYTSTSGVSVSLTGDTGAGKTGALYAALSIWGHPKDMAVLETTDNGLTGRFLGLHNLPIGLDEVGNMHGRLLSQLVHKISQGKAKIRMQASINAEREHEMSASLVGLFTTNHSLIDKLTITKKDPNGEIARLIEFYLHKPQLLKDNPEEGRQMFNPLLTNHGWAGPDFIKALVSYEKDYLDERIEHWVNRFKTDFGDDTAYRFYENLVAVCMLAGEICDKADIVHIDVDRVYNKIVGEMIDIRDNVVKANNVNYLSLIGEFISQHNNSILEIHDSKVIIEPRNSLYIRLDTDKKELCITKSVFRKFLIEENSVSPKQFVYQMQQHGIKIVDKKKKMAANWKPGLDEFNTNAYIISTDTLPPDVIKEINPEPV